MSERIEKLLRMEIPGGNVFVDYLVIKTKEAQSQLRDLQLAIVQGEKQLSVMKETAFRLQGQAAKYLEDLEEWDRRTQQEEERKISAVK